MKIPPALLALIPAMVPAGTQAQTPNPSPSPAPQPVEVLSPLVLRGNRGTADRPAAPGNSMQLGTADLAALPPTRGDYQDLFASIAGAYAGNPTSGTFSLRGVNQDQVFPSLGTSSNPLIQVLEDGAPLSPATLRYLPPVLWDLQSAEVLRGPQALDAGPASLAGALHLHSTLPGQGWNGHALLEAAEYETLRSGVAQDIPLIPGELAARFSYYHQESDGQETNLARDDDRFGETSRNRYQLGLAWRPHARTQDLVTLSLVQESSRGNPLATVRAVPPYAFFDRKTALNTPSSYPADRWAATLNARFELPAGMILGATSSYQRLDVEQHLDFDSNPTYLWFIDGFIDERHFTQDLFVAREQGPFQWRLGAYYEDSSYDNGTSGRGLALLTGLPFANTTAEQVRTGSLYGRFDQELAPQWHLLGGVRWQYDERTVATGRTFSSLPAAASTREITSDDLLPELALAWRPQSTTESGLRFSRGLRPGGVAHAAGLGLSAAYDPESSWDLEWYFRRQPADSLQFSAAIFHSWMEDQQVAYDVPGGFPGIDRLIANAASATRYGAEVEARWQPAEGLSIHGSAGWIHTRFDDFELNGVNRSGQAFPNAPEWTTSLGVDYQHRSGVFAATLFTWSDRTYSDPASPQVTALESRDLLSAKLGYRWREASLYLFGTNLLDDDYALSRIDNSGIGLPTGGKVAPPRMFGVGCEVRW